MMLLFMERIDDESFGSGRRVSATLCVKDVSFFNDESHE